MRTSLVRLVLACGLAFALVDIVGAGPLPTGPTVPGRPWVPPTPPILPPPQQPWQPPPPSTPLPATPAPTPAQVPQQPTGPALAPEQAQDQPSEATTDVDDTTATVPRDEELVPPPAAEPAPPSKTAEDYFRERFPFHRSYADGVWLGSTDSNLRLDLLTRVLDAPLKGTPAVLVLLHPEADASDIDRIRNAAGSADVAVPDDPSAIETFVSDALARFAGRPVFVVGHIEGNAFELEDRSGTSSGSVGVGTVEKLGADNDSWVFMLGCGSAAGGANIGTLNEIDTAQFASALGQALNAATSGDVLRAFAASGIKLAVTTDASKQLDGQWHVTLTVQRLERFGAQDTSYADAVVAPPPPEWAQLVFQAFPDCDRGDEGDRFACRSFTAAADDLNRTIFVYWPWGLGGALVLLVFLGRRG